MTEQTAAQDFDLASWETLLSADLPITDPSGAPTPMVVTIAGPEHPQRKRARWASDRGHRARAEKSGKLLPDPETQEAAALEELVASTLGWAHVAFDGQVLPFSPEAARKVFTDPRHAWFRNKVRQGFVDEELFIKRSASA